MTIEEAGVYDRGTDLVWGASEGVTEEGVLKPGLQEFFFNFNDHVVIQCVLDKIIVTNYSLIFIYTDAHVSFSGKPIQIKK